MKIGLYYSPGGSVLSFGPVHIGREYVTIGRWHLRIRGPRPDWGRRSMARLPTWTYVTHNLIRWQRGRLVLDLQWRWGNLWIGWHRMRTGAGRHTWICLLPMTAFHILVAPKGYGGWTIHPRTGRRCAHVQVGPQYRTVWPRFPKREADAE